MRRNPSIEEAPLQGDLMLFDPETSKFYVLNQTMAYVWKNWDGDAGSLATKMEQDFANAEPSQLSADVDAALSDLRELGLFLD